MFSDVKTGPVVSGTTTVMEPLSTSVVVSGSGSNEPSVKPLNIAVSIVVVRVDAESAVAVDGICIRSFPRTYGLSELILLGVTGAPSTR